MKPMVMLMLVAACSVGAEPARLVYRNTFDGPDALRDWHMEGPGVAEIDDGRLFIHSKWTDELEALDGQIDLLQDGGAKYYPFIEQWVKEHEPEALAKYVLYFHKPGQFSGGHIQFWNRHAHPENFVIRLKFQAANPYPLHMVTFCGRGVNGEDILDPKLRPRFGLAAQYMFGDIRNCRISYWSGKRGTSNMRRAPGRKLTSEEKGDIPAYAVDREVNLEITRWKGRVVFKVDGKVLVDWTDDEPFGDGFFSLRLMAAAKGWYDDYEVYELHGNPFTPHAKHRDTFFPNVGSKLRANPVRFLWPEEEGENLFRLGRTPDFSGGDVYEETTCWSFVYTGKALDPGTWFWQVNDHPVQQFTVPEETEWSMELPGIGSIAGRMPMGHPRLLLFEGEQAAFAKRISPDLRDEVMSNADLFMTFSMSDLKPPQVDFSRISESAVKRLAINDTKVFLGQVKTPILYLAKAWLLTGDERYAEKCVEMTLGVRNLDPRLVGLNDFTRSAVQDTLVFAYDSCFEFFTADDRAAIQETIRAGGARIYDHLVGWLESHMFDNHSWQKTFASLMRSAVALHGHEACADEWLEYCYELWFARAPAGGFNYDGGWFNGPGYLSANIVTLIQVPMLWQRLAGIDAFGHPWFQNAADSIIATWPPGSYSSGFGDGHSSQTHPHWKRGVLMELLAKETANPRATWYVETLKQWEHGKKKRIYDPNAKHKLDSEALEWFVDLSTKPIPTAESPSETARVMPDTGVVSIQTKPHSIPDNFFVAFRSSSYGSGSHCLASQNAFNIIAGGKPLFLSSGYYTSFSDPHTLLHYRHSRGHNTVLADGIGQSIGNAGFGQLRRFHASKQVSYVMGDASHAYGGDLSDPMWIRNFQRAEVEHSRENGFGDAGVTKYLRHLLFIHPIKALVILDELEGNHPIEWSRLLHSPNEIADLGNNRFQTDNGAFVGHIAIQGGTPETSTEFFSPAINWAKAKAYDGSVRPMPKQWHLTVKSKPVEALRAFMVIQMTPTGTNPLSVEWTDGGVVIGGWRVASDLAVFEGEKRRWGAGSDGGLVLETSSSR